MFPRSLLALALTGALIGTAHSTPVVDVTDAQLIEAQTFLEEQDAWLVHIVEAFPELRTRAVDVQALFRDQWSEAMARMAEDAKGYARTDPLPRIVGLTREAAEHFLSVVEQRALGEISPDVRATLLSYHYLDRPDQQAADGFYERISSSLNNDEGTLYFDAPLNWVRDMAVVKQFTMTGYKKLEVKDHSVAVTLMGRADRYQIGVNVADMLHDEGEAAATAAVKSSLPGSITADKIGWVTDAGREGHFVGYFYDMVPPKSRPISRQYIMFDGDYTLHMRCTLKDRSVAWETWADVCDNLTGFVGIARHGETLEPTESIVGTQPANNDPSAS